MQKEATYRLGAQRLAAVVAIRDEIQEAKDYGWPMKAIWRQLQNEKRFPGDYQAFLRAWGQASKERETSREAQEKNALVDLLFKAGIRPCHVFPWRKEKDYPPYCGATFDENGDNFSCKYKNSPKCLSLFASHKALTCFTVLFLSCCFMVSDGSIAQATAILDDITKAFGDAASTWKTTILNYAEVLFWGLGIISLVYTTGMMFLEGADIQKFFAHFIRFIMFFGFFLFLLRNGPYIGGTLIDSMLEIGAKATGTGATSASGFMDTAFEIFDKILDSLSIWSPGVSIMACIMAVLLLLVLSIIAANLTIEYCAAWMLLYAGCFFLGFGATRWTSDMALNYFKAVLGSAVRLFSMILIIGVSASIVNGVAASMSASIKMQDCAMLLITAVVVLAIMNKVPAMLANVIGGGMGAGNLGTGAVMAAAGGAAAVGSFLGAGVGGAVTKGSAAKDAITKAFSGMSGGAGGGSGPSSIYSGAGSSGRAAGGAFSNAVGGGSPYASPASSGESKPGAHRTGSAGAGGRQKETPEPTPEQPTPDTENTPTPSGQREKNGPGALDYLAGSARHLSEDLDK